jgi:hypothetical protein
MSFSFSKREKILVLILGSAIYIFIFIKFILMSAMPDITSAMLEIGSLSNQKAALDNDVANIEMLKENLHMKELGNQRLDNYLLDSASITDSLEYIQKLAVFIGKDIRSVNIGKPEPKTAAASNTGTQAQTASNSTPGTNAAATDTIVSSNAASNGNEATVNTSADAGSPIVATGTPAVAPNNETAYYEFDIAFSCTLNFEEVNELAKFIEGGSQKVRIKEMAITSVSGNSVNGTADPGDTSVSGDDSNTNTTSSDLYNCNMKIAFYVISCQLCIV